MRETDVSPAQYGVLMNVGGAPGMTAAELARRLGVTPQNVAVLVAALERRGLVERRAHPAHGRVRDLHLTADGTAALERADAIVSRLEAELVGALGGQDARSLAALLRRLGGPIR